MTDTTETPAAIIQRIADAAEITMAAEFVPFSRSRNASPQMGQAEPWKSLNWRVTLQQRGRAILTCDYAQGTGHTPAGRDIGQWDNNRHIQARAVDIEIETGKRAGRGMFSEPEPRASREEIPAPSMVDVLASLARDSDVIDHPSFESWATEIGYNPDSRAAEATYRLCLSHTLALRAALGDSQLIEMRDAAQEL